MNPDMPMDLPTGASHFPASDERPADYPAELPFVPGVVCMVHERTDPQGEPTLVCTWIAADEDESSLPGWRAQLGALAEGASSIPLLSDIVSAAKRTGGNDQATRAEVQRVMDSAPPSEREALDDLTRAQQEMMRGTQEMEDSVERVARVALEASLADGWVVESDDTMPFPVRTRIVKMRRGDRSRAVSRFAAAFGGQVTLVETAVRDG